MSVMLKTGLINEMEYVINKKFNAETSVTEVRRILVQVLELKGQLPSLLALAGEIRMNLILTPSDDPHSHTYRLLNSIRK